jgi:hypothetical protein
VPDVPVDESFVKTANAGQLHDEARGQRTKWPASFTSPDGGQTWVYRVDRDDVDSAAVAAAIAAHTPNPDYGLSADALALRELRAKSSLTAQEVATAVKLLLKGSA